MRPTYRVLTRISPALRAPPNFGGSIRTDIVDVASYGLPLLDKTSNAKVGFGSNLAARSRSHDRPESARLAHSLLSSRRSPYPIDSGPSAGEAGTSARANRAALDQGTRRARMHSAVCGQTRF